MEKVSKSLVFFLFNFFAYKDTRWKVWKKDGPSGISRHNSAPTKHWNRALAAQRGVCDSEAEVYGASVTSLQSIKESKRGDKRSH